jgi:hypothetical protein
MRNATTIIALALVGFFIVLAVIIGSRLSEQAVSMLAGTACGVGVAIPLGVAIGMYVAGQRRYGRDSVQPPPPQIVIVPQAQPPASSNVPMLPSAYALPPRRRFSIIGENGLDEEDRR